jgi:ABC-type transport system involved in multi-copper enzyme maturation permease subunit
VNALRDVLILARFDLATAIRTRRALAALLIYLAGALLTGGILVWVEVQWGDKIAMARTAIDAAAAAASMKADAPDAYKALSTLAGGDEELVRHMLHLPLVVLGFFWTTLTFLPLLVALVSHDIVNAEVRNRSARFVLLRTTRTTLLVAKMLSHGVLFLAVTMAANLALFVYAWVQLPSFEPLAVAPWLLRYWLLTLPFGLCYIALTALVSSLVDSGGLALAAMVGVLIGLGILSSSDVVGFLSPSWWKVGLWSPSLLKVTAHGAAFLAFGGLFLGAAWARLRWRDL